MRPLLPLAALAMAGCLAAPQGLGPTALPDAALAIVDPGLYADFHATDAFGERLHAWAAEHPGWVEVRSLGQSLEGRDLWMAVLTDPQAPGPKRVAFLDGGHHGNEVEGEEAVLYTGDFLLANRGNATVRRILAENEVWLVPLVNPDGHAMGARGNAMGVNLNRNYDIDWGHPAGGNNRAVGVVVGATGVPIQAAGGPVLENPGTEPFSEPETRAIRDALGAAGPRLAFYLTFHTNAHSIIGPWGAFEAPFPLPPEHVAVLEHDLQWARDHTEFLAGKAAWGNLSAGLPYAASGTSMDWAYLNHSIPSYTFEQAFGATAVLTPNFAGRMAAEDPGLEYWMRAGLPFVMHLLVNAGHLQRWELATEELALPEGVPPEPPAGWDDAGGVPEL